MRTWTSSFFFSSIIYSIYKTLHEMKRYAQFCHNFKNDSTWRHQHDLSRFWNFTFKINRFTNFLIYLFTYLLIFLIDMNVIVWMSYTRFQIQCQHVECYSLMLTTTFIKSTSHFFYMFLNQVEFKQKAFSFKIRTYIDVKWRFDICLKKCWKNIHKLHICWIMRLYSFQMIHAVNTSQNQKHAKNAYLR